MSFVLNNPAVMGILNITPDSFSDGGQFFKNNHIDLDLVLRQAEQMQQQGALLLDVGGESTRPGAQKVPVQQELDRVIPVIEKITKNINIIVSIDTSKAEVMSAAARAGAGLINDVCALQTENALGAAAASGLPVCLMHMQGNPQTMQQEPKYTDVVGEVKTFLAQRIQACVAAGISREKIIVDPGFGFGKTLEHNLKLVKHLASLQELACPVLIGLSRKSMISKITGDTDIKNRLPGSLALAWACLAQGAKIVRAHDIKATVDMLKIYRAIQEAK